MYALRPLALALLATLRDMAPILVTITLFQGLVLGVWPDDLLGLLAGLIAILIGHTVLVRGLVEKRMAVDVLARISSVSCFETERGAGMAFQVDVEEAVGLMRQIKALEGRNHPRED